MAFDYKNEIPSTGSSWPIGALYCKHPTWNDEIDKWRLCREAHEISGGFAPSLTKYTAPQSEAIVDDGSYLVPNIKESTTDFALRVSSAKAPRFVQVGIASVVGKLTGTEVVRSNYPQKLLDWMNAVDSSAHSWDTWLSTILLPLLERYGVIYTFIRRPEAMVLTEAQRMELGVPEVTVEVISPEVLENWEEDQFGDFEWVRYVEEIKQAHGPDGSEAKRTLRHWYLTRIGWWAVEEIDEREGTQSKKTGQVVKSGMWPDKLGYVPVTKWTLPAWPTYQAALACMEHYRVSSDMRHLEQSTAFSMTWLPVEGRVNNPREMIKGPDVVATFPAESRHTPIMLSPDPGPFTHFMERLPQIEADALACYGLATQASTNGSGVSLAYIEGVSDALYRAHSIACEADEHTVLGVVADMLRVEWSEDQRGQWPREFGTLASTKQLEDLQRLIDMAPPPDVIAKVIAKAVTIVLPGLSPDERTELEDAIVADAEESAKAATETNDLMMAGKVPAAPAAAGGGKPATLNPKEMAQPDHVRK